MNTNCSIPCILVFTLFLCNNLCAQENVVTGGGEATGSGGTVSYSIGQIDYIEKSGSSGTINEGVQQPYEFYIVGIDNNASIVLDVQVFPNPTKSVVILKINQDIQQNLSYSLVDMKGSLLADDKILYNETIIPLNHLNSATYLLNVRDNKTTIKTFRIIKN